ncbi:MAG: His/Gly/Thr/Pro-type tRNA ligase C-terminal domain-containing protein [Patescibacteria group bacterium]|nr:His/Gly/Thr/Pro-type tRNA ligase C-terminal domain-containing protein [Patescibacteria group bacterium]
MKQSDIFTKTSNVFPKDEVSTNARLLIKAGYIEKLMAGVYTYLYFGWRVIKKIENIIREEMDQIGGQEIFMPALQPKSLWDQTGRWSDLSEIMYQFKDRSDHQVGLAITHEEVITDIIKKHIKSYKDLPKYIYQIQNKYRDEPRAKSGLIRGREFLMKDLYSFHADENDLNKYYEIVKKSYLNIFKRCGLKVFVIEASGGAFTKKFSHEFSVLSLAGEDRVILCSQCDFAQNQEISEKKEGDKCPRCSAELKFDKGIEVGNIFKLGTRFSQAQNAQYTDVKGNLKPIVMACYGIGLGRLMGTIVEIYHDEKGIIWPDEVAPFKYHLLVLGQSEKTLDLAKSVYDTCLKNKVEILYDDRKVHPGQKLNDSDLLGIPNRLVVSDKNDSKIELKKRSEKSVKLCPAREIIKIVSS